MLVELGTLPETSAGVDYFDLPGPQRMAVDDAMPFQLGTENDGGGDRSHMHYQNFCANVGYFVASKCDKLVIYRSAPGHSYLNTIERGMSLFNISLANHTTRLDPASPDWLVYGVLKDNATMKQVRKAIAEYDRELAEAIIYVERHVGKEASSDNADADAVVPHDEPVPEPLSEPGPPASDDDDDLEPVNTDADAEMEGMDGDDADDDIDAETTTAVSGEVRVGHKVSKFFEKCGWYEGEVTEIEQTRRGK